MKYEAGSTPGHSPEDAMRIFLSELLAEQELLGRDFSRVLHDNLWRLYVRTDHNPEKDQ